MNYKIHITKKAEADLISAADYIEFTLLNPKAADDLIDKAEEEINKLSFSPKSHKLVEEPVLKSWGIRFILINNYMAFFKVDDELKTVFIIRFLYGKRNWAEILKNEPFSLI